MSPNPQISAARVAEMYRQLKDVSGALEEVAAVRPQVMIRQAPKYAQMLNRAAQKVQHPVVQRVVSNTSQILSQLHKWQLQRKLEHLAKPTIPVSVGWDNLPAGTLGAQATVLSPYTGQPFRVTEITCTAAASFRFTEFNIGGSDFGEPSRTRVTYGAGAGIPAANTRGLDFPQIKARDMTRIIDANWAPWTKADFTSDATITLTPFNYGVAASSVLLTIFMRSSPCGFQFKSGLLVPAAEQAKRNAIMGATYLSSLSLEDLE